MTINDLVKSVPSHIESQGASRVLIVGGAVRDLVLGLEPKDFDIEVYGMEPAKLEEVLSSFGKVSAVGRSFGVLKLTLDSGEEFDVSIPRRENKEGRGHKGFLAIPDPSMSIMEAASRRDFTMNSLALDVSTGEIIDEFGGVDDIKKGVIRHTSDAFSEDPLRVLRGMQFAGRFNFSVHPDTTRLCQEMIGEFADLPIERVWEEWLKWAIRSKKPSMGIEFLIHTGWAKLFPELWHMNGVPQDPEWHPEGDVMIHTMHVVDAAARIADREGIEGIDRGTFVLAALCHDMGKPAWTKFEARALLMEEDDVLSVHLYDARWRSRGHESGGVPFAEKFLNSIGCLAEIKERVLPLVSDHLFHQNNVSARGVRRLARRLNPATIKELVLLIEADSSGRPPLPIGCPESALALLDKAGEYKVVEKGPTPILMGRHLIESRMMKPCPMVGILLKTAFEAQLDGEFDNPEDGMLWMEDNYMRIIQDNL